MRCLMGIKILRLAQCAGHHKKSHYFWECDQSHSQIDPSDRYRWYETPNYPTLGVPTFGGSQKGSLRCSHPAVPFFMSTRDDWKQCPLLAQSGHEPVHRTCPFLGVKRTCRFALQMSAFDPKRTSNDGVVAPKCNFNWQSRAPQSQINYRRWCRDLVRCFRVRPNEGAPGMKHLTSTACATGIVLSMLVGNLQAQQVPIPQTAAEVSGPAPGPMTQA